MFEISIIKGRVNTKNKKNQNEKNVETIESSFFMK